MSDALSGPAERAVRTECCYFCGDLGLLRQQPRLFTWAILLSMARNRGNSRERYYIGSGLAEQANDRLVARRQKRRGMQWSEQTSTALATLRSLVLNEIWDAYWQHGERAA